MVKIKEKPTPRRARILQELNSDLAARIMWGGKGSPVWSGIRSDVKISTTDLRALLRDDQVTNVGEEIYHRITHHGQAALLELEPDDFFSTKSIMTEADVLYALTKKFNEKKGWDVSAQVSIEGLEKERRVDAVLFNYSSLGKDYEYLGYPFLATIAVEIKVARGDFLHELNDPTKRLAAEQQFGRFAFAAPAGMILKDELPAPNVGLFEIDGSKIRETVKPDQVYREAPDWKLFGSYLRGRGRAN